MRTGLSSLRKSEFGVIQKKLQKLWWLLVFTALLMLGTLRVAYAQNWTVYNNIRYDLTTTQETADFYILNHGTNPTVVFIHGGGWETGDKSFYAGYYARLYANAGFNVVAINYRLASYSDPATQWNAQLQDAQEAMRFIRAVAPYFRIDTNRIAAAGDSAGAHLAVFLGSLNTCAADLAGGTDRCTSFSSFSSKANAVLDMFGPVDLTKPEMYNGIGSLALFGQRSYAQVPDLYQNASPIFSINGGSARTCIVQGLTDTTVPPPSQSYALRDALIANHVPYQLITYNGDHGFAGLSFIQRTQVDLRALNCMIGILHPNPLNAR
jgi:acetyl esterase/lipase